MKEAKFINKNIDDWRELEKLGNEYELSKSDTATKDYIKANNDLSFARTFYEHSNISRFLNGLATKLHTGIHVTEVAPGKEFKLFFTKHIPSTAYNCRKHIHVALLIFAIGVTMGFLSSVIDPDYTRGFMGDGYVNMTIENIKQGKPMDVYASSGSGPMFTMITFNNILVSFRVFAAGIFFGIGSGLLLLYNAVMVGTFLHLFHSYEVLDVALRTIMIHGSIELSVIILAAAAGLRLGSSFMFPGTLARGKSFLIGAKDAVSLLIGLIPFFVVAGFLESFITRQSGMPLVVFYLIIILSLVLVWGYFSVYPKYLYGSKNREGAKNKSRSDVGVSELSGDRKAVEF